MRGLEESLTIPYPQLLFGLGIRYVGTVVAERLAHAFLSIDLLGLASVEELTNVPEIGRRIAESVVTFFAQEKHKNYIDKLKRAGLQLKLAEKAKQTSPRLWQIRPLSLVVYLKTTLEHN